VPHWHYRTWGQQRGRSRNKVAVGEPAAGSPPLKRGRTTMCKGSCDQESIKGKMQFLVIETGMKDVVNEVYDDRRA
jgi:hypothetical protein